MKYRQEILKLDTLTNPKTLIWCVLYREIENIPKIAADLHYLDYTEFNQVGDAFFKSPQYLVIQKQMQEDIKTLADIILHVPPLKPEWETSDGRKQIVTELNQYFNKNFPGDEAKQNPISW
jgi:hypothetical protein